ncbi:TPA: sulfite exporter TauE/SafE family protein [Candidatus Scatousia excrementigallinarum]|uniref:Sulfite exporter TauE/SafE family protein n=1 Tax=Candidatus Scatousia excrementigallinarum TaxID=2840935 RepID=A0A9D1JP31_9BACT|nr:sulfite exporter TauE/SafE family protein [Candidatus Scatousia excrementigallinarum]
MENYVDLFTGNSSIILLFGLSFLGGLVASVSPCSLAMLPIIIGYVGGYSEEKPFKTFLQLVFFIMGTAIVFSIIGIICAATGKVFVSVGGSYFSLIIASIVMIMGLKLVGFLDFDIPVLIKEMPKGDSTSIFVYPLVLGGVFALAGTPCSTPILAAIMAFASLSASLFQAVIMLFLFSLGQGLILVLAGVLTSKLKTWKNFYKLSDILLKISGVLLIITSLYIFYKIFAPLIVK